MTSGPWDRLGVGIDVEAVARFAVPDPRLFTPSELRQCAASPQPSESRAGRWCAKEAVVKAAARFRALTPRDVEVLADHDGRPRVRFVAPDVGDALAGDASITHAQGIAAAVAVVWPRDTG